MRHAVTVEIEAVPELVWTVLEDVTSWPSWSPTMTNVRRLEDGPFGLGSTAEVHQPKLPKAIWRVTEFERGRRFEWTSSGGGITNRANHVVEPADGQRAVVRLELEQTGPFAPLVGILFGSLARRYVDQEAASLKQRCEAQTTS